MSMCRGRSIAGAVAVLAAALCLSGASAIAATGATKDEAVTMVKKAVGAIKSDGTRKAYAEISDHGGPFVDRDLYIVVYNLDGLVLAHGADEKRIGTNQIDDKDAEGKTFVKERVALAKAHQSFWQQYKFVNPVTQTVQPKDMYCERLEATVVCGGVYQ